MGPLPRRACRSSDSSGGWRPWSNGSTPPAARIDDLRRLEQVAAGAVSRSRFVGDLTLDPPRPPSDLAGPPLLDEDWLVLSTVHSAKGGEWDVVHLLHASDGMFPSDMATGDAESIEEERRLLYVAVTRARARAGGQRPPRYHHHGPTAWPTPTATPRSAASCPRRCRPTWTCGHEDRARADGSTTASPSHLGPALGLASVDSLLAGLWS